MGYLEHCLVMEVVYCMCVCMYVCVVYLAVCGRTDLDCAVRVMYVSLCVCTNV